MNTSPGRGDAVIEVIGLEDVPLIKKGDDLGQILFNSIARMGIKLDPTDILVVTQKIVSKAEGRIIDLDTVRPSKLAETIAHQTGHDPRHLEVILGESKRIVKMKGRHLITELRTGHICANAGVDRSNVDEKGSVTLLPLDPDESAVKMRRRLKELSGVEVAIIISDTSGRPFRMGQVNLAVGSAGIAPLRSYLNRQDIFGRELTVTAIAIADELASAAELVMNKTDKIPAVLIRGYRFRTSIKGAKALVRPAEQDLFA